MHGGKQARKRVVYVNLIFFIVICGFQLYKVLDDFVNGSKWANAVSPVSVDAIEFPTVTLCNYNRVNRSQLPVVGITEENMRLYVERLNLQALENETLASIPDMSLVDNLLGVVFESFWNVYQMMPYMVSRGRQNITNMALGRALYNAYMGDHPELVDQAGLLHTVSVTCLAAYTCAFNGMFFDCCENSYQVFTVYGSCFTVVPPSTDGVPTQKAPGSSDGLQLTVCSQQANAISTVINNRFEVGYHLFVGYGSGGEIGQAEVPSPAGFRSRVEIKRIVESTTQNQIGLFEKPCVDDERTSILHLPYTVESCIAECYIVDTIDKCKCVPAEMNARNGSYKSCQPDDLFLCVNPKVKAARHPPGSTPDTMKTQFTTCRDKCRKPCSRHSIELTSSLAVTPSKPINKEFVQLLNSLYPGFNLTESGTEQAVYFDIYFKDLKYTHIVNYPRVTLEQLLGNVGGVLGLWIGASLFTIVELIESCCSSYSEKRKVTPTEKSQMKTETTEGTETTAGAISTAHPYGDILYVGATQSDV